MVDDDPPGAGVGSGGDVVRGCRPGRLLFTTLLFSTTGTATTTAGVPGLSLFIYPCVIACPVSFSLFAVYVRFLLILSLVKFLSNEESDI